MAALFADLRYTLRRLRQALGFALTAVLTLALGIGATTAIFSIVNGVLLRPLPFTDPNRLVLLGDHLAGTNWGDDGGGAPVTGPEIRAYAEQTNAFLSMGGYGYSDYELAGRGEPVQVHGARLGAGVFPTLGVAPLLGRVFTQREDVQREPVAVLSYQTWRDRFAGDPHILGAKILLDRKPYLVIGVMPRQLEFPLIPGRLNRSELWVPLSLTAAELTQNGSWRYEMVARLKAGVSAAQAQGDAERVAQQTMRSFPAMFASLRINALVRSLQQATVVRARSLLWILFLAVSVVLLICCANLAGLLLVRAIRRQREIAVRLALGAPSVALVRQALLEGLLLSVSGGVLGILLALLALRFGRSLLPESLPRLDAIGLDWSLAGFALLLAVGTGLLCGLLPAFAMLRTDVNGSLKEGGRSNSAGGSHTRLRSALVISEVAVAMALLAASGLLLRSFEKMTAADLGFRPEHVVTANYALPEKQYAVQPAVDTFNNELLRRLGQQPGSEAVGLTSNLPVSGGAGIEAFVVEGLASKGAAPLTANSSVVLGDLFRSLGIPLLRGRFFTDEDRPEAQLVVIVNHKLAEHYWPHQDPIGKRMRNGTEGMATPWLTIVGEVGDVKLSSPDAEATEQYYQPIAQVRASYGSLAPADQVVGNGGSVVLRSALPPEQMENALRAAMRGLDPQLALTNVQTMDQAVADSEASRRFNTALITGFALAAVLLAVLGVYSVIAFSVASREQEMAIRLALGSPRAGIVRLVVASGAKLAAAGCALGLTGAAAASGLLRSLLFEVNPFDPPALLTATAAVLLLALGASVLPALRAAAVEPVEALRGE